MGVAGYLAETVVGAVCRLDGMLSSSLPVFEGRREVREKEGGGDEGGESGLHFEIL